MVKIKWDDTEGGKMVGWMIEGPDGEYVIPAGEHYHAPQGISARKQIAMVRETAARSRDRRVR